MLRESLRGSDRGDPSRRERASFRGKDRRNCRSRASAPYRLLLSASRRRRFELRAHLLIRAASRTSRTILFARSRPSTCHKRNCVVILSASDSPRRRAARSNNERRTRAPNGYFRAPATNPLSPLPRRALLSDVTSAADSGEGGKISVAGARRAKPRERDNRELREDEIAVRSRRTLYRCQSNRVTRDRVNLGIKNLS